MVATPIHHSDLRIITLKTLNNTNYCETEISFIETGGHWGADAGIIAGVGASEDYGPGK